MVERKWGEEWACGLRGGGTRSEWCGAGRCTPDPLAASRSDHVHRSMKRGSSLGARALHPCAAFYRRLLSENRLYVGKCRAVADRLGALQRDTAWSELCDCVASILRFVTESETEQPRTTCSSARAVRWSAIHNTTSFQAQSVIQLHRQWRSSDPHGIAWARLRQLWSSSDPHWIAWARLVG